MAFANPRPLIPYQFTGKHAIIKSLLGDSGRQTPDPSIFDAGAVLSGAGTIKHTAMQKWDSDGAGHSRFKASPVNTIRIFLKDGAWVEKSFVDTRPTDTCRLKSGRFVLVGLARAPHQLGFTDGCDARR